MDYDNKETIIRNNNMEIPEELWYEPKIKNNKVICGYTLNIRRNDNKKRDL